MNLRKVLLMVMLILVLALFYSVMQTYVLLLEVMGQNLVTYAQTTGGSFNALIVWLQFPLLILIGLILMYVILGDKSLTAQAQNAKTLDK